jgi:hypothetical protein
MIIDDHLILKLWSIFGGNEVPPYPHIPIFPYPPWGNEVPPYPPPLPFHICFYMLLHATLFRSLYKRIYVYNFFEENFMEDTFHIFRNLRKLYSLGTDLTFRSLLCVGGDEVPPHNPLFAFRFLLEGSKQSGI